MSGPGVEIKRVDADGALPVAVPVAAEHDFLASVEARLADEVAHLVGALLKFSAGTQSISEELPRGAHFGKNVTLFLSLASAHVAQALLQGRDKPLLADDGFLQLSEMGLSLQQFVRELDLDGRRFLAVALVDQQHRAHGPTRPVITRVPYPQTAETSAAWIRAHGVAVAELARQNQIPRLILVDLLRGRLRGNRGQAHQGAIVLGLKADPAQQGATA